MNSSGLLKIAGKIDPSEIDTLYRDLIDSTILNSHPLYRYDLNWPEHCKEQLQHIFREFGPVDGKHSWFTNCLDPYSYTFRHACDWHRDGHYDNVPLASAYPTQTEFKLPNGEIYIPEVGEVLEVNLSEVEHRCNSKGWNQPRLMMRVMLAG